MSILLSAFFKGLVFGATMAAIPGPIFFLIVQRTLSDGVFTGLACALGAVAADVVYALIAIIGLTFIMQFLLSYQLLLSIIGGLFLLFLGTKIFFRTVSIQTIENEKNNSKLLASWLSTFLLTLANPVTIISYCVIFAAMGINEQNNDISAGLSLISGVILGALSIVITLISFLSVFREKLTTELLIYINKAAGIILIGFGIGALFRGFLSTKC